MVTRTIGKGLRLAEKQVVTGPSLIKQFIDEAGRLGDRVVFHDGKTNGNNQALEGMLNRAFKAGESMT